MARMMPVEYLAIKYQVPSHDARMALQANKVETDANDKFDLDAFEKVEDKVAAHLESR